MVRDSATGQSKCGYCSFVRKADAQTAMEKMDGNLLGCRKLRTSWSRNSDRMIKFAEVFSQSSPGSCTVFVTGCTDVDSNGDSLRRAFAPFGRIVDIRREIDKGTAFVKYDAKESACQAIVALNMGTYIGGQNIKCSWSKIEDKVNPQEGPAHIHIQLQPEQVR